jgi:hypothetical protein
MGELNWDGHSCIHHASTTHLTGHGSWVMGALCTACLRGRVAAHPPPSEVWDSFGRGGDSTRAGAQMGRGEHGGGGGGAKSSSFGATINSAQLLPALPPSAYHPALHACLSPWLTGLAPLRGRLHATTAGGVYGLVCCAVFKAACGPGVLSVNFACSRAGLVLSPLVIMVLQFCCVYNMHLLIALKHRAEVAVGAQSYGDLGRYVFGSRGHKLVNFFVTLQQMGICCVYFQFVSASIDAVLVNLRAPPLLLR